jgi:hypothetical protein
VAAPLPGNISEKNLPGRKFHLELFMPGNMGLTNQELFEES